MIGVGEVLATITSLEKLGKFWSWIRGKRAKPTETVATRFIRLFESHGVHRNQIPRFIGHGLTVRDVQDDVSLLSKLDEPVLEAACARFSVRREWLDGAEPQIHPCHDFYKHPEWFAAFLDKLLADNPEGQIIGVLIAPEVAGGYAEGLLILQETVGAVGDKPIYRYHLCNDWLFAYWKARAYLTACVAIAWRRNVFVHGIYMPWKEIQRLYQGETLLGWQGEGIWGLGPKRWDPEDMALRPDAFLKAVDRERDNYGIKSGLQLWLELEASGLMDIGLKADVRPLFQAELAKW